MSSFTSPAPRASRALAVVLALTLTLPLLPQAAAPASGAVGAAGTPRIPAGTAASYVVFDRVTGRTTLAHKPHVRFRSASVVKILIALDYLESRTTPVPRADADLLRRMLRASDDDAATAFWRRGGQGAIIGRMTRRLGLADTGPPPANRPGFWGYTALSAADVVTTYRYLLERAKPKVRDVILGHLRNASRCAADDFDQYFGIPGAVPRPWAVKQGWSGYGSRPAVPCSRTRPSAGTATTGGSATADRAALAPASTGAAAAGGPRPPVNLSRPVLHTTGLVGEGDRLIIAVLTLQPAGAGYRSSATRLTALAKDVYRAALRR
ncbi:lipoprotein [Sphaerisporangium krabiense]|uniref:Serine hydrolase n=1 Tax=Sphaerisporangium krabiense TaxID=763782 RepID=A0A7W8ZA49_9ACTN|nr:hypothetical protein [Sphaerisporangium krabiense]MBB5630297.1 hypothetical protein [Sphaerisporangium krabiense]GII62752.1 lipoprotein [Sphaerisporangium krabiense]